jgi:serine/threonine protein kinase
LRPRRYEKEWKDCVIHRDLKPDNLLVTTDNVLKLTDFGEARAAELNLTMTAVGTPIYVCPEIIRNDRYDTKADSYSFGIVLVAMMRIEESIVEFFFNALMRKMGKTSRAGIGLNTLNVNLEEGWRPKLPAEMYPSLINLIVRCWDDNPAVRPSFDEMVQILLNEVSQEVRNNPEPRFGSGKIIGSSKQVDVGLKDNGDRVPQLVVDQIVNEHTASMKKENNDLLAMYHEMKRAKELLVEEIKMVRRQSAAAGLVDALEYPGSVRGKVPQQEKEDAGREAEEAGGGGEELEELDLKAIVNTSGRVNI